MQVLDPRRTVAVILGSSAFPHHPGLASPPSFRNSARDIQAYLTGQLGIASQRVLDLFDSELSPMHLLFEVESFLRKHTASSAEAPASDFIFYYVGHGGFVGANRDYYLAIRSTRRGSEGISSIKLTDLANTLNEHAASIRRYLVLDCCFAASAYKELQAGPLAAVQAQTEDVLPPRGTALLAAAGRRSPAEAPEGEDYTMFSGALLEVLRTGEPSGDPWWTLTQVGDRVRRYLRDRYAGDAIRPEVLSPAQSHGDLARDVPLFPNPAVAPPAVSDKLAEIAELPELPEIPELRELDDSALLTNSEGPSAAAIVELPDLPESFRAARSTRDLLAAWKTEARAAMKRAQAHPNRAVMRRLVLTFTLYMLGLAVGTLPLLAVALIVPASVLSGRAAAWLGLALTFACVALALAAVGLTVKRLLGARLRALVDAWYSYRRELAAMSAQQLTAYARTMTSLLQRWHLGRRSEVIHDLGIELERSIFEATKRHAVNAAACISLEKASANQRDSRVIASALAAQAQRVLHAKSLLLSAREYVKETRAAAGLLRGRDMQRTADEVYAVSLFRAASAAFLRLADV